MCEEIYYRNWLLCLCRLRNPAICRLPSASWRPGKASGVVQSESEGLRMGGWWLKSLPGSESQRTRISDVWAQENMDVSSQAERTNSPSFPLFALWGGGRGLNTWGDAHPHWGAIFFTQITILMLIFSGNPLTDTPRNHVSPALWASLRWHIKLNTMSPSIWPENIGGPRMCADLGKCSSFCLKINSA